MRLRFVTYLAPSLPEELFRVVARRVGAELGCETSLLVNDSVSGPPRDGAEPFGAGEADVGFLCAPPFRWLRARRPPPVELVPAALWFDDPRTERAPIFFADVIVPARAAARSLADLRGKVWAYNDVCSLSGYQSLRRAGVSGPFVASGSHLASLAWVAEGRADAAAIDSNVLRLALRRDPPLAQAVRVVASLGPFPIQPVVARQGVDGAAIARVLLAIHDDDELGAFGVRGFVPVADSHYTPW